MKRHNHYLLLGCLLLTVICACEDKNADIVPNLTLDKDEIKISAYSQSIDINLKSNVDFDITTDSEWITVSKNYTRELSYITISVIENINTENDRTGIVKIIPHGTSESLLIKVIQEAMGVITIDENIYYLSSERQKLTISVKHNYDYDIIIPDAAQLWIEVDNSNDTKALVEGKLSLYIQKNEDYTPRKAQLIISMPSYNEQDTIIIEQEEGFESLRKIIRANKNCSLFYEALKVTGLEDSLINFIDPNYPIIDYEWTRQALYDDYSNIHYFETAFERGGNADRVALPTQRLFKYTVFMVTDSILSNYNDNYWSGGIHNLDELREYARKVYINPEYLNLPDTSRNSPLNKLISYHILPCWLTYDQFNTSQPDIIKRRLFLKEYDVEDFYETLLPHSIMRISTPYPGDQYGESIGIFINRKGSITTGLEAEGTRIARDVSEYKLSDNLTNICANGGYHYVNKILLYDNSTRYNVLLCRMRIMGSTLSPDFINSGARGRFNGDPRNEGKRNIDKMSYTFKSDFCKNVYWTEGSELYVRYRDKTFSDYYGDVLSITGSFDVVFKLPPVAFDATYEIRHMFNSLAGSGVCDRSIVQYYIYEGDEKDNSSEWLSWNWAPCGNQVNLGLSGDDESIGVICDNDDKYMNMSDREMKEAIHQDDLALRNKGYMKAPDSYTTSISSDNSGDPMRLDKNSLRKIICRQYISANKNYYIRIKKVDGQPNSVCPLNYLEMVPKDIYDGPVPEDEH